MLTVGSHHHAVDYFSHSPKIAATATVLPAAAAHTPPPTRPATPGELRTTATPPPPTAAKMPPVSAAAAGAHVDSAPATSPSKPSPNQIANVSAQVMQRYLPQILAAMPKDWRGTTFKNSNLLGRDGFADRLVGLMLRKAADGSDISSAELVEVGNAEDYMRVATNVSTTLEIALAQQAGCDVEQVFTFASNAMPVVAVALTAAGRPVRLYLGEQPAPFSDDELATIALLGGVLTQHPGPPEPEPGAVVLGHSTVATRTDAGVDGVVAPNVLYIAGTGAIQPAEILVIRKRMSTPATTPVAEAMMQAHAGVAVTADRSEASAEALAEFHAHLQTLCGTEVNTGANPVVFTAGLPSLCALWVSLIKRGGADVLMCSTAYGGCSQLTDIVDRKVPSFRKHTFDIQGLDADIVARIQVRLDALAAKPAELAPTTVVMIEIPTNPDMKVPDMAPIASMLRAYRGATGKAVVLLIDATFAPGSQVMKKLRALAPELTVISFISLSKSVSRGLTTGGAIVANHTDHGIALLETVWQTARMLDTTAKKDQLLFLTQNHKNVEARCQQAYEVAVAVGDALRSAVREATAHDMPLAFVRPDHAKAGFTSSTFSFNLPAPAGATAGVTEALAQRYVDLLTEHPEFKPCVSFGQDNALVYATVPATSTQGAIKAEDKAKQAVGGVQLVRLSFPPTCDTAAVIKIVADATAKVYA